MTVGLAVRLAAELDHLDRLLLGTVSTTFPGSLTADEKATTHAYLVLAHAVLEEYLENTFEAHFERLLGWLCADQVPMEVARLAFAMPEWFPQEFTVAYKKRELAKYMPLARKEFAKRVRASHGLKSDNVADLARLIGLDWKRLESELNLQLIALDTLGSRRGEAGHLSPFTDKAVSLSNQDYPDNVREWVHGGRDAVEAIASYLDRLLLDQQPMSLIYDWDGN